MERAVDDLRQTHAVWLRTLHLHPLMADAVRMQLVSESAARDLASLEEDRQALLMSLEAPSSTGDAPPHD